MTPHNYYTMDKLPCKDNLLDLCIVNHNTSNYNAYKLNRRRFNLKIIFSSIGDVKSPIELKIH